MQFLRHSLTRDRRVVRATLIVAVLGAPALSASCRDADTIVVPPPGDVVATGTWGGDNAGWIVADTVAHVHVACTFGDVPGRVPLDAAGGFDVEGSYVLRAHPVYVGPSHPARFTGRVYGPLLTFTVTVNDTVEKKIVVLGPKTVQYGVEPRMGPCPICTVLGAPAYRR
jgi:hypothetical protein